MLLLLLLGAGGAATPSIIGYANISYRVADDANTSLALVNTTDDSVTLPTDAYPSEE